MEKNLKLFKNWFKLTKPSIKFIIVQFSTVLLRYVFLLISPIFAAKAITCLSVGNYKGAIINLSIDIVFVVLSAAAYFINYYMTHALVGPPYVRLQQEILHKVLNASDKNFKKISKEKLINIIGADVYIVAGFSDVLAGRTARFARVVVTLAVIFFFNYTIGLIAVLLQVINYFILNNIYERKNRHVKRIKESNDRLTIKFSQYMDSKDTISGLNIKTKLLDDYTRRANEHIKDRHRNLVFDAYVDNAFFAYYKIVIYLISILMIFLITKGAFDLTAYLILVPYLLSSIEISNEAFQILPKLKEANIAGNRIKSVLNFTTTKHLAVGENIEDIIDGIINFENVSYKGSKINPKIQNVDIYIRQNQTTLFLGSRNSGKRTIYNLITREIKPSYGKVLMSGLDIFEFTNEAFNSNLSSVTTTSHVFKGSIMKNFKIIESNIKKIYDVCEILGIKEVFDQLPNKFNTDVEKLTTVQKYLLAVARALLTGSEIIALYEIPANLSSEDSKLLLNCLKNINGKYTLIIFGASEELLKVSNKVVKISGGKVENIFFSEIEN